MRTESLRELASFVVRFLRKGGAISRLPPWRSQVSVVWAAPLAAAVAGSRRRGGVRSGPVACVVPRMAGARRERRRAAATALLTRAVCGPGTLDSIREVCLCEVWPRLRSVDFRGETRAVACVSIKNARAHAV